MAELLDLPALLQGLADARRTGTLVVHGPGGRRALLFLREGTIGGAWDGDPEVLGKALVRTGVLEWERLAELLDFFRPAPAALERVVVEQGAATAEDVARARAFVAREVLFDVLTWSEARAELKDGPPLPDLVRIDMARDDVAVATKPALMHATVQRDEWMRWKAVVPSDGDVLAPRPDSEVGADGAHADVLALVDGERDVHELLARARLPRAETARILRELLVAGAVRVLDRSELLALARRVRGAPRSPGWGETAPCASCAGPRSWRPSRPTTRCGWPRPRRPAGRPRRRPGASWPWPAPAPSWAPRRPGATPRSTSGARSGSGPTTGSSSATWSRSSSPRGRSRRRRSRPSTT